jgi:hypothetical protein
MIFAVFMAVVSPAAEMVLSGLKDFLFDLENNQTYRAK